MVEEDLPPLLNSEDQYRKDIEQYCSMQLSHEERDELLSLARLGDHQAKETLICSLLPVIMAYACRLQDVFAPFLDLVSLGNLLLVERFDKALEHPCPLAYLQKCINCKLINYLQHDTHLIKIPTAPCLEPYKVLFILDEFDTDKFDIPEEDKKPEIEESMGPIYKALNALPTSYGKEMIARVFGLLGRVSESLEEISGGNSTTKQYQATKTVKLYQLKKMRSYLNTYHAQFVKRQIREVKQHEKYVAVIFPEVTLKKLEQATQQLQASGETLSMNKLRTLSGVHTVYASAYLERLRNGVIANAQLH